MSVSGVTDDVYPMTDNQTKLQALLDIASHYGQMHRITYGASKTKITVVGSEIDCEYFAQVKPWRMDNETVKVVENNYQTNQEGKNVELRLQKGRAILFSLLGAGFSYKCLLSHKVKLHLYRTYTCPILRSGLLDHHSWKLWHFSREKL